MPNQFWAVLCLTVSPPLAEAQAAKRDEVKPPSTSPRPRVVRVYTNDDLDRVAPYRDQTGALSAPAAPPPLAHGASGRDRDDPAASRNETYWRREADRVRERTGSLRRQIDEQRRQRERARQREADRSYGRRKGSSQGRTTEEIDARVRAIEREIRERESELEDRARRAGALPGWLR